MQRMIIALVYMNKEFDLTFLVACESWFFFQILDICSKKFGSLLCTNWKKNLSDLVSLISATNVTINGIRISHRKWFLGMYD